MAFGGICGSLLGGYALTNLAIDHIFLLFSLLPSVQLLSCGLVKESPLASRFLPEHSNSGNSQISNGDGVLDEDISVFERSSISTSKKRKKSPLNKKKTLITSKSEVSEKDRSLALQWFVTLKMATYSLCSAFRQPIILR